MCGRVDAWACGRVRSGRGAPFSSPQNLFYIYFDALLVDGGGAELAFAECGIPRENAQGGVVAHLPLETRRRLLMHVVTPIETRLEPVKSVFVPEGGRRKERAEALVSRSDACVGDATCG